MKTPKTLGDRVLLLREHHRLNQYEFGAKIGLSHVAVGNIERGGTESPHKKTLNSIVQEFGTTIDWLLEGRGEMIPGGSHDFQKSKGNIYQDALYKELKEEKESWKQKFEQLFDAVIKGGSLGKLKAINIAGRSKKFDRLLVVRDK